MQRYIVSEGFGSGLSVGTNGRVYRFQRPVSKVLIRNTGSSPVRIGFNARVIDADQSPSDAPDGFQSGSLVELTDEQARDRGIEVPDGESVELEGPRDETDARRQIYTIWAITVSGSTTIQGGSTGI